MSEEERLRGENGRMRAALERIRDQLLSSLFCDGVVLDLVTNALRDVPAPKSGGYDEYHRISDR